MAGDDAAMHDSQVLEEILDAWDTSGEVWADVASNMFGKDNIEIEPGAHSMFTINLDGSF